MPSNAKNILSAVNLNRGSNQFKIHDESQQAKLQAIISAITYKYHRSLVSLTQALKIQNNMQPLSLFNKVDAPPVQYIPSFLSKEDADLLLLHCLDLEWQQNQIKMHRLAHASPKARNDLRG